MSDPTVVAPEPPMLFVSIDRPDLQPMGPDELELCSECGHMSGAEYEETLGRFGHHCLTCRGFRIVHGYTTYSGRGYPVAPLDHRGGGAASAPLAREAGTPPNNRRSSPPPLLPAA